MATTKVSKKYLTSVPSDVRRMFGLEVGDELEWLPMAAEIVVKPRRKKIKKDPLLQMVGLVEADPSDVTKNHNKILYGR
ncbi:MAG: AbrB/MazE/SpoVT family DNA-binding domain-containing protein [Candidatus Hadarchaeota archaeon]